MVCAEAYAAVNAAMCACALPLGGKLAGLPAPGRMALAPTSLGSGAAALGMLAWPALWPLWILGLPTSVAACFGAHGVGACVRCTLTTLGAALLLGGACTAISSAGLPALASLALAAVLGTALYLLTSLAPSALCDVRQVELKVGERAVILPAMLDSGNRLRDPVTGMPVVVVPRKAMGRLFPGVPEGGGLCDLPLGFRLLSVRTAAGSALLPLFRPEMCTLYVNGHARQAKLLVAVAGRDYGGVQALVPTAALETNQGGAV